MLNWNEYFLYSHNQAFKYVIKPVRLLEPDGFESYKLIIKIYFYQKILYNSNRYLFSFYHGFILFSLFPKYR